MHRPDVREQGFADSKPVQSSETFEILQKLKMLQLLQPPVTADLRERFAEYAEDAAIAAVSEVQFVANVGIVVNVVRQWLKPLPE